MDVQAATAARGSGGARTYLHVNPEQHWHAVSGLSSPVRISILKMRRRHGPLNVNCSQRGFVLPQSAIATHTQVLEEPWLVPSEPSEGRKGNRRLVLRFDEIGMAFDTEIAWRKRA